MDEKFFEMILRRGLGDDGIRNVRIKRKVPAVEEGENFLSQIWRYSLGYFSSGKCNEKEEYKKSNTRELETKLIVKCQTTTNGPGSELIKNQNVFGTELKIFKTVLPELERLVKRQLAPKFFHFDTLMNDSIIVLEDLSIQGFRTKDRQKGLSMAHVLMVLETIANFHAASVHQYEENPEVMKSFTNGIMTESTPKNMFRILEQTLQMVCDEISGWPDDIYRQISKKLAALMDKYENELLRVTEYDDGEFCVLNHGDCWVNNIMFREDEQGNPLQLILMCVYSSPVIDLVYFLSTCPAIDIKTENDDYFLNKYLETLTGTMKVLGCKTPSPSMEDLRRSILKRRMWAITAAITFYPRMLADSSEIETFDKLLETGKTQMNIFKNPDATRALKKLLPVMEKNGYFD